MKNRTNGIVRYTFALVAIVFILIAISVLMIGCNHVPREDSGQAENNVWEIPVQSDSDGETGQQQDTPETESPNTSEVPSDNEEQQKVIPYIKSLVNGLNVRRQPTAASASLGSLDSGDMVGFVCAEDGWHKIRFRGTEAYVSARSDYTTVVFMAATDQTTEKIIAEGVNFLGTKYVYGAVRLHDGKGNMLPSFSTDAFDCSSFVQYAFYKGNGILLDVTTRTQSVQGQAVVGELKRGDVMFFTNASRKNNVGVEKIGHVAIYLGDNYILHTASDYAVIEQISAQRWNYYLFSRRMTKK